MENIEKKLWDRTLEEFPILKARFKPSINPEIYEGCFDTSLLEKGYIPLLYDLIFDIIENNLTKKVGNLFWGNFNWCEDEFETFKNLKNNITLLYNYVKKFYPTLNKLEELRKLELNANKDYDNDLLNCIDTLNSLVFNIIFTDPPSNYEKIFYDFYLVSYKVFNSDCNKADSNDLFPEIVPQCCYCRNPLEFCKCKGYLDDLRCVFRILNKLNITLKVCDTAFLRMLHDQIAQHVMEICKGNFYVSTLPKILEWFESTIINYLNFMKSLSIDQTKEENLDTTYTEIKTNLVQFIYENFTTTLISQLFCIIIEYPESFPAVEDLCKGLEVTKMYDLLVRELKEALVVKLLHSGVSTTDILTAYIAAFRALDHIDRTGYLIDCITTPIKMYLKSREDTVHCVVSSITDDGSSDVNDELVVGCVSEKEDQMANNSNDDNILEPRTQENLASCKRCRFDLISVFVNMFGSKQMFIDEYRKLLADRVLTRFTCNLERELRLLELLKIRFGEADLLKCEVVLKDIQDSLKVASNIENDAEFKIGNNSFISKAYVISSQFWPPFKDISLQLPDEIQDHFDSYRKGFEKYKTNRTIRWKPYLGVVNLDIILKNRTITVTVTPAHAVIIYHFQKKEEWNIFDLQQVTQIAPVVLRKKISYWISQGILYEKSSDLIVVVPENVSSTSTLYKPKLHLSMIYEEDDFEPAVITPQEMKEEELQVFWSYIVGMLNNLNSLSLDRIFQMLSMFAAQGSTSELTPNQLKAFLDIKVKTNKLLYCEGYYRLPK